jgi:sRNA-binding protein
MSASPLKKLTLLSVGAALLGAGLGCGSNPPCDTDISAVDAARSRAQKAQARLEEAKAQKEQLQRELAEAKARREKLEKRKAELEAKIRELGG